MTRRHLAAALALAACSIIFPPASARAAEKTKPLQVTYYYLPG
jgi:hypothetical protein